MPRLKDQALCIRLLDWSETSQVVTLLTRERGKVRGLAKGSRRMSPGSVARYSGGFELLTGGQVVGMIRPSGELATITEWDLQQPYRHFRTGLAAQRLGLFAADMANALLADHDAHPAVFDELARALAGLADEGAGPGAILRFQWRLLEDCGYRPELEKDAETGEPLAERQSYFFDARAGGFTMQGSGRENAKSPAGPWKVRGNTVALLRAVAGGKAAEAGDGEAVTRANRLLCVYARAILDRQLPTMGFVLGEER